MNWRLLSIFISILVALAGCSDSDTVPDRKLPKPRHESIGLSHKRGVLISDRYEPVWVQYALKGFDKEFKQAFPSEIVTAKQSDGCKLTPVADNDKVYNVHLSRGGSASGVYAPNRAKFKRVVLDGLKRYKKWGEKALERLGSVADNLGVVDVIITDSSQPLHINLVGHNKVWNIVASEHVEISRITVIGRGVGIINQGNAVPVEWMAGEKSSACGVYPAREPNKFWRIVQKKHHDIVNRYKDDYKDYAAWYSDTFRRGHFKNLVTVYGAHHVLLGPLPATLDQRLDYPSADGAKLTVPPGSKVVVMPSEQAREYFRNLTIGEMEKAAGGNLASLRNGN